MEIQSEIRQFEEFFDRARDGLYKDKLKQGINNQTYRLIVNTNDLRNNGDGELVTKILRRPQKYIIAMQQAAQHIAEESYGFSNHEIQIGFEGSFGRNSVSPRGLTSSLLSNLVEVEGIVTKLSIVRPKIQRSIHLIAETGKYVSREYRDATAIDIGIKYGSYGNGALSAVTEHLPTGAAMPSKDKDGKRLELEHGLSQYKDYQTAILQEMPERAKVGQLPRSVEIILEHDLVDRLKPGDRVRCVGVYLPLPTGLLNGSGSGIFKSLLLCNNVAVIGKDVGNITLTPHDVSNIRGFIARDDMLQILSRSFCPSIFGHEYAKKALILQLLGGNERNLENGTHLRGDINIMLVGDPSTAKSQLLRSMMEIAPLAISTTGRGSSGVGLTAAVTNDPDIKERRLEAGAMVLADRGIVCIDEFDKMSESDRVAIHEVMEQQTVTIAKAGLHASLNARCSVLAAANPVYGQYDREKSPQRNIGLPDSLLSRFDLLFIVLDQLDPKLDRKIASHVVKSHQYRRPGTIMEPEPLNQISKLNLDDNIGIASETVVWQHGNHEEHIHRVIDDNRHTGDVLTKEFFKKYIYYAKTRIQPTLSEDAMTAISNEYANMRSKQSKRNLPITARTLETLIRLSTASAKVRLSVTVDIIDVEIAIELLNFVLFHDVSKYDDEDDGEKADENINTINIPSDGNENRKRTANEIKSSNDLISENMMIDDDTHEESHIRKSSRSQSSVISSENRYEKVCESLYQLLDKRDEIELVTLLKHMNHNIPVQSQYTEDEIRQILYQLYLENKIFFNEENDMIMNV